MDKTKQATAVRWCFSLSFGKWPVGGMHGILLSKEKALTAEYLVKSLGFEEGDQCAQK